MVPNPDCIDCARLVLSYGSTSACRNCVHTARIKAQAAAFAALTVGHHVQVDAYGRVLLVEVVKKNRTTFDVDGLRATANGPVTDTSIAYKLRVTPRDFVLPDARP